MNWTRHLRIRHLVMLTALHDTRNLSHTARQMGITQPALSKWLREMERDLGVPLFERHHRGLVPTEYCDLLVARAHLVLNELNRTASLLDAVASGTSGSLHIGCTPVAMTDMLPTALAELQQLHPSASIRISDGTLDTLLPQLESGKLDLIVSRIENRRYSGDIAHEILYEETTVVIAGVHHPLAGKKNVSWPDALAYPWVGPPSHSPLRAELEQALALAQQPFPQVFVETSATVLNASLLQRTTMLGIISGRPARYLQAAGRITILDLPISRNSRVGVMWRRESPHDTLQQALLEALRKAAEAR